MRSPTRKTRITATGTASPTRSGGRGFGSPTNDTRKGGATTEKKQIE